MYVLQIRTFSDFEMLEARDFAHDAGPIAAYATLREAVDATNPALDEYAKEAELDWRKTDELGAYDFWFVLTDAEGDVVDQGRVSYREVRRMES